MLSNAKQKLRDFAGSGATFDRKFALGRETSREVTEALDAFGTRNCRISCLSRLLGEIEDTATLGDAGPDHRFVGTLSLRPNLKVAAGLWYV